MQLRHKKCLSVARDGKPDRQELVNDYVLRTKKECKRTLTSELQLHQAHNITIFFLLLVTVCLQVRFINSLPIVWICNFH